MNHQLRDHKFNLILPAKLYFFPPNNWHVLFIMKSEKLQVKNIKWQTLKSLTFWEVWNRKEAEKKGIYIILLNK